MTYSTTSTATGVGRGRAPLSRNAQDLTPKDRASRARTLRQRATRFWTCESGTQTVEAVIWLPLFAFILAFIVNIALVFFNESQMLRVAQDANRMFSTGRFTTDAETETWITENLAYLSQNVTVDSVVDNGMITTELSIPALDMMPMRMIALDYFATVPVRVVAQHVVEY